MEDVESFKIVRLLMTFPFPSNIPLNRFVPELELPVEFHPPIGVKLLNPVKSRLFIRIK